jgi:hypothetical protein
MAGANNPLAEFMAKAAKEQDEAKWVRGGFVGGAAGHVSPLMYTTSNNTVGASYMAASSVSG